MDTDAREHPSSSATAGRPLVLTLLALLALTVISWAVSHVHLGRASTLIALAIAAIKASLVAYAFMELPHASAQARIMVAVTVSFIALLCAGAVADVAMR
jgi:cytochrome c oxidase subunit 4